MTKPELDIQHILYQIQQMNQDERSLLLSSLNLSSEEQLLNYFSVPSIPLEDFTAFRIHKYLLLYVPPVMIFIGTIGNILSFVVFRAYSGKVSTYTYLGALAMMDLLVIYIGLLRLWIAQLSSFDIKDQTNWTCKLVAFLGYVCSDSSVWLIVAVTVERYIAVCYPLQASNLCRLKKARFTVLIPILSLCIVNSHFFWTVQLRHEKTNTTNTVYICDAGQSFTDLVNDVWVWVDAGIYSFVPFVILSLLNGRIIQKVCIAKNERTLLLSKERTDIGCNSKMKHSSCEVNRKLTIMLLMVSFTFLLTTLPMNIILIMTKSWNEQNQQQKAAFYLAKTVSELLMYLNHTINFFLYCISGRKFRRQIFSLFSFYCCSVFAQSGETAMTRKRTFDTTETIGLRINYKVVYKRDTTPPSSV
ncbi:growth hormone secretagogue receptor type 1-like [Ylistrum balloti]|uniref:growth hormone secretagogue receptor type 1-like n=1 Tax=Ylistrum balloti TaxID=509963 RepID=UPI0029059E5D|nr:growth hormone secretagogue receptor type 1-like [Ylistrum balloti]